MILPEFSKAINWACNQNQDEAAHDILIRLLSYANEPGINISDIREQIACMIAEIGNYMPVPDDMQRVNLICETWKLLNK